MTVRFASQTEIDNWDELILANPDGGNIVQSIELANLKSPAGWRARLVVTECCAITIHEHTAPLIGKLWYIPKGPGVQTPSDLAGLISPLRLFAQKHGVFAIKIEPEILKNDSNLSELSKMMLAPAHSIQPNSSTVVLDISKDTTTIMAELPQKARHAIKRAYRDGIVTKKVEPTDENFSIMISLIQQTMADKSATIRDESYYKKFWKTYTDNKLGALFFAYQDNNPIAGAFVLTFGQKATYKDGGSVRQKTIYGASHALQWCVIEWLKTKGITDYDLCGTPPTIEVGNKNHPHYGIGLFKTSFKKTITEYVGAYDIVVRPFAYRIWASIGERVICRYYASILNKLFY